MKIHHVVLMLVAGFAGHGAFAAPVGNCAGTPSTAVVKLPAPLNRWGQIACTPYGQIISNKEGWIWSYPGSYTPVFVPSQMVHDSPKKLGNKSYFTSITMTKVKGVEFEKAYSVYHSGFDKNEALPVGYRLNVTSVSGKALKLYFFDYGNYAWGIWCREACDPKSRFMILNMAKRPNKALQPTAQPLARPGGG